MRPFTATGIKQPAFLSKVHRSCLGVNRRVLLNAMCPASPEKDLNDAVLANDTDESL